jgi:hypothetical protein
VFDQGFEYQLKALATIRQKFAPVTPARPAPWARPEPQAR